MNIKVRRMRGTWTAVAEKSGETRMKSTGVACKSGSDAGKRRAMEIAEMWAQTIDWRGPRRQRTLPEWCQEVLDGQYTRKEIEGASYRGYTYIMRNVRIWFKTTPIEDVTPDDLRGFVTWLMGERELSASTAKKHYNFVSSCLKKALAERIIEWNPAVAVKAPKSKLPAPNPLTEKSLSVLVARLSELSLTQEVCAAWLALYTGMRRGEICALRWRSVDLDNGLISVTEAIGAGPEGFYIKGTKTGVDRVVPIPPQLATILRRRRVEVLEECMTAGIPMSPTMFVCGTIDETPLHRSRLSKWWTAHAREWALQGTQGRRPVFHDLRHTYATLAVRTLDLKTAQDVLGHSTPIMTMRYADTETMQVMRAAEPMGQAFPSVVEPRNSVLEFEAM